jgi:hypothetical protein
LDLGAGAGCASDAGLRLLRREAIAGCAFLGKVRLQRERAGCKRSAEGCRNEEA